MANQTPASNDYLSALIQLQATRHGIDLRWTGKGLDDLIMLITSASRAITLNTHLWRGLQELWSMKATKELPEEVYLKLSSIILATRTTAELDILRRDKKIAAALGVTPPEKAS